MDATFGALYVGTILATVLYGVSCAQVFYYFQHYSEKDGRGTKAVVITTLLCDTIHQALICHSMYTYVITNYSNPEALGHIVWSLSAEVIPNSITAVVVQTFFAVRIWKFSQGNVPIAVALAIFIAADFIVSIVYAIQIIPLHTFAEGNLYRPGSMTINVLTVTADVLITVVFCVLLHRSRTNIRSSDTMINLLIAFTVQTGMLTSLFAIGSLISSSAFPNTFMYICFYYSMGRLYCNSLLAALNVRRAIRGRAQNDFSMSLRPTGDTAIGSKDNRAEIRIKTETVQFVTGEKSRGCDGSPVFTQSNANSPRAVEGEYDLESARRGFRKASDPTKSKTSSITSL